MALLACSFIRRRPTTINFSYKYLYPLQELNQPLIRDLHGPPRVNEYSETPLYPPIPIHKDKNEANVSKTKQFMANLGTVEEKQYQINRPKAYGWYSYIMNQDWIPSDSKEFLQFSTQTAIVDGLPDYYNTEDPKIRKILDEMAPLIEQTLCNHYLYSERQYEVPNDKIPMREKFATAWPEGTKHLLESKKSKDLVKAIHQIIMGCLVGKTKHLNHCSEDHDSRNEAFWFRGGIGPDKKMLSKKLGVQRKQKELREKGYIIKNNDGKIRVMTDEEVMQPYERALQYKGENTIQLRASDPLPPFVERDSPLVTQSKVPSPPHDPRIWGFKANCQHGTNIPGCWPDADHQHGLLMYVDRMNRWNYQAVSSLEALSDPATAKDQNTAKALLSCFGWLLPQACHLGFSPITDITFPLATQATLTDGQHWSYYAYQLNTTDLSINNPSEHKHNNVMWVGEDRTLFEKVENGKVINFDPTALMPLIKMYLRSPSQRNYDITPYLSDIKTVSNFPEPYQRQFLLEKIREVYSNRPKHFAKPEMYLWEKLHLVDHPGVFALQRGLRNRRWFQMYKVSHLGKEHWHPEFMSLDENQHRYIPKALRPEDFMRKKGLGRRYSKWQPKLSIPLEDKAAVYKLPKTVDYQPDD